MPGLEAFKGNVADFRAYEAQSGEADRCRHVTHLTVLALGKREADPTGGDVGTEPYGRGARPQIFGLCRHFGDAGLGAVTFDFYTGGEFFYGFFGNLPLDLSEICARVAKFGVEQFFDERPVVCEEQGSFAVVVEAACGIDSGGEAEFVESLVACFWCKLAKYAKGLVEENDHQVKYRMKPGNSARAFRC